MAAKPLIFELGGNEIPCHLSKVDRSKLYGYVDREVLNDSDAPCTLATLASDGQTLIGSGGTSLAYFDPDGQWCDKGDLTAVDQDNEPVKPVGSSFKAPIPLKAKASIEDYLSHNIHNVYLLVAASEDDEGAASGLSPDLVAELKKGTIYTFPFSYRGGLDPDTGFLLQS